MARVPVLIVALALAGCAVEQPSPDLCNMPVGLRGWGGPTLRLRGTVNGSFEHGFMMMDEHCPRGGELKVTGQTIDGDRMLSRFRAIGPRLGVTRMEIEARIETPDGKAPTLRAIRYFGGSFQSMTAQQLTDFDRKRGM